MEIAAATVSFVGLSGQILQGCNYLCKVFSDARDAPDVISDISKELHNLRSQLEGFRLLLLKVQDASPASLTVQQDPAVPLQSCQDAIQKLQSFVDEHADLSKPAQTKPGSSQTRRNVFRKAWQKFDVAKSGDKLKSCRSRMEAAKTSLLASHHGIQIALELQLVDVTREVQRDLQQLQLEHTASARVWQETRDLATDIKTLQEENHFLTKINKVSLDQVLSNSQMLLTQSASSDQAAHDVRAASNRMDDAFESLSADLRKGFDNLPTIFGAMVKDSIEKCQARHNALQEMDIPPADQIPVGARGRIHEVSASDDGASSSHGRVGPKRKSLQRASDSSITSVGPYRPYSGGDSIQSQRRGPKRQHRNKSIYNLWFGRIEITSSTTEQEIEENSDYIPPMILQARQTSFKLIPSTWFLKIGLLFESGDSRPTLAQPGWDNRLRVVRTHPYDSAVFNAIECGDYFRFRQLLTTGEVGLFDTIGYDGNRVRTLFESVIFTMCIMGPNRNHSMHKSLLDIAKFLTDSGIDCGLDESMKWIMYYMVQDMYYMVQDSNDDIMSLFRIVMAKSRSDPFECLHTCKDLPSMETCLRMIVEQDEWDVSELRTSVEKNMGKGSWQFMLGNQFEQWWNDLQCQKWRRLPASLRRSKSYCLSEFGEVFVDQLWGARYWSEERPAFWQSRKACEEFFGSSFVEREWPSLYWKEELPSFWRSRKACEELFGSHFVCTKWPSLYWKEELPPFWRSRQACEELFGLFFVETEWPSLYWKEELPPFWRSRQACEEFFGLSFVETEWPSLYWKEELPSFWRSRKACEELFGSSFVEYSWPSLYWRQELPTFWHSRKSCQEFFDHHFVEVLWPKLLGRTCFEFLEGRGAGVWSMGKWHFELEGERYRKWRSKMTERWLKSIPTLRHSRQHCIDQFGTSFVQDKLPSLLRADGLPEEDVLRLTQYGPDMDPPRPYSYRGTEYESGSEPEEYEADGGENGERGSDDDDGNGSENEGSNGWETADEG